MATTLKAIWANDGSANAPTGTPQHPSWFTGDLGTYVVRPPWEVAGVDYRVGINTGATLKDPAVESPPSGVAFNTGTKAATVSGTDVVLDGWDFSDWQIVNHGTNTTIRNCLFAVGANGKSPISCTSSANGVTIEYNDIDGGGVSTDFPTLINCACAGPVVIRHNWIRGQNSDAMGISAVNNTIEYSIDVRYNLIEAEDTEEGAHADIGQTGSGIRRFVNFIGNTIYCANAPQGTQGAMFLEGSAGSVTHVGEYALNTIFARPGPGSQIGVLFAVTTNQIVRRAHHHDNFIDPTELFALARAGSTSSNSIFSANINMLTGVVMNP